MAPVESNPTILNSAKLEVFSGLPSTLSGTSFAQTFRICRFSVTIPCTANVSRTGLVGALLLDVLERLLKTS